MNTCHRTLIIFTTTLFCLGTTHSNAQKIRNWVKKTGDKLDQASKTVNTFKEEFNVLAGQTTQEKNPDNSPKGNAGNQPHGFSAEKGENTNNWGGGTTPGTKIASGQSKNISINGAFAVVKNILGSYTFQVVDCLGSSSDQTVTISFLVEHSIANQLLIAYSRNSKVFSSGKEYSNTNLFIGSKQNSNMIPTDVPVECRMVIRNVVPSVSKFDAVDINMKTENFDGRREDQKGWLQIRNLKILWN